MGNKRILVVDDEPTMVELLREILSRAGHVVDAADCGTAAIDLVRERIYDAAILDFQLPDTNGVMLHRQIRQLDEELADNTLFISGLTQSDSDLDYFHAFGRGFLAKPFRPSAVLESLEAFWS